MQKWKNLKLFKIQTTMDTKKIKVEIKFLVMSLTVVVIKILLTRVHVEDSMPLFHSSFKVDHLWGFPLICLKMNFGAKISFLMMKSFSKEKFSQKMWNSGMVVWVINLYIMQHQLFTTFANKQTKLVSRPYC